VTNAKKTIAGLTLMALLSSCATPPIGPTVQVMPAPGKPFELFAQEEGACKAYAQGQIAGAVDQANNSAVGTAVLGTVLGAGLGAAVGGGRGAGIGAASGAVVGTGVGADGAGGAQMTIQQRYDIAYSQCMYSKGDQVPGFEMSVPVAAPPPPSAPMGPRYDPTLVLGIQTELGRIGLLSSTPDGAFGPKTRGAIMDYEKMRNLPRDGIPTQSLLEDLKRN
jgi:peptidoglycan hydrolase-like protein with peptidoglycan-binding domain